MKFVQYRVTGGGIGHFPKENDRRSPGWLGFFKKLHLKHVLYIPTKAMGG